MSTHLTVNVPRDLWLTSNRPITHHGQRARIVRQLHALAATAAAAYRLTPHEGTTALAATWTIRYPKGTGWKHGDPTNAHPTTKALLDGLVEAKYLPGDGPLTIRSETFRRAQNTDRAGFHVVELVLVRAYPHGAEPDRMRALYTERFGL